MSHHGRDNREPLRYSIYNKRFYQQPCRAVATEKLPQTILQFKVINMRLLLFASITMLLTLSSLTIAGDYVSADQAIKQPAVIPAPVQAYLAKEIASGFAECKAQAADIRLAFEAKTVDLNSSVQALVVKPRSRCFCSSDACPMWVFAAAPAADPKVAKLIFESPMAGLLSFSDRKTRGYPDIKVSGGLLSHGYEVRYVWDGAEYQEIYNQVWVWNAERECNEAEIEELKDGKWIKTSNECLKI